jgi:hypothetical protein
MSRLEKVVVLLVCAFVYAIATKSSMLLTGLILVTVLLLIAYRKRMNTAARAVTQPATQIAAESNDQHVSPHFRFESEELSL